MNRMLMNPAPLTVTELIDLLQREDPDLPVIVESEAGPLLVTGIDVTATLRVDDVGPDDPALLLEVAAPSYQDVSDDD